MTSVATDFDVPAAMQVLWHRLELAGYERWTTSSLVNEWRGPRGDYVEADHVSRATTIRRKPTGTSPWTQTWSQSWQCGRDEFVNWLLEAGRTITSTDATVKPSGPHGFFPLRGQANLCEACLVAYRDHPTYP